MMKITFPGNKKVDANFNGFTVHTDQARQGGGDGTAPAPFDYFLASLGTCAGIYVLSFLQSRNLPTEGVEIEQKIQWDPIKRRIGTIALDIQVPKGFPEKYKGALVNAANLCAVKQYMENPPAFDVYTTEVERKEVAEVSMN